MTTQDFQTHTATPNSVEHRTADAAKVVTVEYKTLGKVKHYFFPESHLNHMVTFYPDGNKRYPMYLVRRHNPKFTDSAAFEAYVRSTGLVKKRPSARATVRELSPIK